MKSKTPRRGSLAQVGVLLFDLVPTLTGRLGGSASLLSRGFIGVCHPPVPPPLLPSSFSCLPSPPPPHSDGTSASAFPTRRSTCLAIVCCRKSYVELRPIHVGGELGVGGERGARCPRAGVKVRLSGEGAWWPPLSRPLTQTPWCLCTMSRSPFAAAATANARVSAPSRSR